MEEKINTDNGSKDIKVSAPDKGGMSKQESSTSEEDDFLKDISLFFKKFSKKDKQLIYYMLALLLLMLFMYIMHRHEIDRCIFFYEEMLRNQSQLWCINTSSITSSI